MSSRAHVLLMMHKTEKRCTLIQQICKQHVSESFLSQGDRATKRRGDFLFSFDQEENSESLNINVCVG